MSIDARQFLPVSKQDMAERGWDSYDFLVITGDAYVDHPSFGPAIISRLLEHEGYRVAILAQGRELYSDWAAEAGRSHLQRQHRLHGGPLHGGQAPPPG